MATYSPDLRIELIDNGAQSGYWGTTTNNNLGTLIEEAIAKTVFTTLTSTVLWFRADGGISDVARCAAVDVSVDGTITAAFTAYIPPVPKLYVIKNSTSYVMTVRASTTVNSSTSVGGTTVVIPAGKTVVVRCTGTNVVSQFDYINGNLQISGNLVVDGTAAITGSIGFDGSLTAGARLAGTYAQSLFIVTVNTGPAHGYVNGETVAFINLSGLGISGSYVITYISTTSFSFTSSVSQSTTGNCLLTNDAITLNGIVSPGVIIEGSSTLPALRVTQTGTGLALLVEDSANPDTTPFAIDTSGNVGVGTTAPAQLLDIVSETVAIDQISRYSTDVSAPARIIRKSRGTVAAPTIVVDGDGAGTASYQAYDGAAFQPVAQIRAEVDGTPGAGDMPGRLIISTTPDGTATLVDRVTVNNAGVVIIGAGEATATPVGNTLRTPSATGTDKAGSNLVIQSGNGTGTGLSGSIVLQTSNPSTTGTTAGTYVDRLKVQQNGLLLGQYSTMGAGVVPSESYYRIYSTLSGSNVATAQSIFGVGVPLAASTVYAFEMVVVLQKTAGSTSHNISLLFDIGSGTLTDIDYYVNGRLQANPTTDLGAPDVCLYAQVATAIPICSALTTTSVSMISLVKGTFSVGTAGTWTPQYKLSAAPGGAYSTLVGSYVKVYPIGPSGANVNVGGWA